MYDQKTQNTDNTDNMQLLSGDRTAGSPFRPAYINPYDNRH